eukprot:TRINITY_DN55162_c0_g1_i1.p1 TRINITY_DN55162_c0_g1~~TRINITY_DN55162_c0_g1_i1.p1  ORF type:complete len:227 (+),score=17.00 TRINITY_DN55162_c0_g1_i1:26-682(+)
MFRLCSRRCLSCQLVHSGKYGLEELRFLQFSAMLPQLLGIPARDVTIVAPASFVNCDVASRSPFANSTTVDYLRGCKVTSLPPTKLESCTLRVISGHGWSTGEIYNDGALVGPERFIPAQININDFYAALPFSLRLLTNSTRTAGPNWRTEAAFELYKSDYDVVLDKHSCFSARAPAEETRTNVPRSAATYSGLTELCTTPATSVRADSRATYFDRAC